MGQTINYVVPIFLTPLFEVENTIPIKRPTRNKMYSVVLRHKVHIYTTTFAAQAPTGTKMGWQMEVSCPMVLVVLAAFLFLYNE
jgi:hypothetical protein